MHPHLKSLLQSRGLSTNASDADAKTFLGSLPDKDKSEVYAAHLAKLEADDADDATLGATPGDPNLSQRTPTTPPPPGAAVPATMPAPAAGVAQASARQVVNVNDHEVAMLENRVRSIKAMGATLEIGKDDLPQFIGMDGDLPAIRTAMLAFVAKRFAPVAGRASVSIGVGQSPAEKIAAAIPFAMLSRSSAFREAGDKVYATLGIKKPDMVDELKIRKAPEMMKMYLAALGAQDAWLINDTQLCDAMGPRGMRRIGGSRMAALAESTADFGNLTLDAINKSLRFLYLDSPRTWPIWAQKVFNADFKNINRVVLSEAPSMTVVPSGAELKYGTMTDSKETYQLAEYKTGVRFTRRLIINDDMDALANVPRLFANSAARLEDDTAYGILTSNPLMADGNAIFSSAHNNIIATGGGPPTAIAQLNSTATLIETQLGLGNAAVLELEGKFLLVPSNLKWSTSAFLQSERLVASQSSSASVPQTVGDGNPFFKQFDVVSSRRLYANSQLRWILMADFRTGQISTIEMCFLTDEPEPVIRQETDFDTEDVKMLARHTVAAKCIDFRGMASNAGV